MNDGLRLFSSKRPKATSGTDVHGRSGQCGSAVNRFAKIVVGQDLECKVPAVRLVDARGSVVSIGCRAATVKGAVSRQALGTNAGHERQWPAPG